MRQKSRPEKQPAEDTIKDIRRATRRRFSAEEKIRVVLEGLRGEESIAELCRREDIASSTYYGWSKEFLERRPVDEITNTCSSPAGRGRDLALLGARVVANAVVIEESLYVPTNAALRV